MHAGHRVLDGVHWIDGPAKDDPARRARVLACPEPRDQHPGAVRFAETINLQSQGP